MWDKPSQVTCVNDSVVTNHPKHKSAPVTPWQRYGGTSRDGRRSQMDKDMVHQAADIDSDDRLLYEGILALIKEMRETKK